MSKCWNGKVQEHELVRRTFVTLIQVEFGYSEPDEDFFYHVFNRQILPSILSEIGTSVRSRLPSSFASSLPW